MLILKDPAEPLSQEDLTELLDDNKEFDRWLKREKKISNYPNARADRDIRKEKLRELVKQGPQPPTLKRIAQSIELALEGNEQLDILQDIAEFFQKQAGSGS